MENETCPRCGRHEFPGPVQSANDSRLSGLAVASLAVSCMGLVSLGIMGLVGMIIGIFAYRSIQRSEGKLSGRGLAIAGMAAGGTTFLMLFFPALAAIAIPNIIRYSEQQKQLEAKNNLMKIFEAQTEYYREYGHYGSAFKVIEWEPDGETRYSYYLFPGESIQADKGGPYDLPSGFKAFVDNENFLAVAVGNIDSDETVDLWTIDQNRLLRNVIDDLTEW